MQLKTHVFHRSLVVEYIAKKIEKSPNLLLRKSTPDFTGKQPLHESTPLKAAATKEKLDPIQSGVRET